MLRIVVSIWLFIWILGCFNYEKVKKKWFFWLFIDGEKKLIMYLKFVIFVEIFNLKLRSFVFRYWLWIKDLFDKYVFNIIYLWIV